jgi:hypothetical protein
LKVLFEGMQKSLSQQSLDIKKRTFIVTLILIAIVVNLTAVRAEVILNDGFENKNLANWKVSGSPICIALPITGNGVNKTNQMSADVADLVKKLGYRTIESHKVFIHRTLTREIMVYEKK